MLADLKRKTELERAGIRDPFKEHRKTPLIDHLAAWEASLRANRRNEEYVVLKISSVRSVIEGFRWVYTADLSADVLETFLEQLRNSPAQRTDEPSKRQPGQQGRSMQTSNHWLQAVHQFAKWTEEGKRNERNPFKRLKAGNVRTDVRRRRGELTTEEVDKMLGATATNGKAYRGLSGATGPCYTASL